MDDQAFKLLIKTLANIQSDIDDLRDEIRDSNKIISRLKSKVIAVATIIPFLVSMTYKKVDTPPKAVQETVQKVIDSISGKDED